jgi:bifunctional DNA-binding transcriptional regulator/antitoxin component of YhaV-PrlF toxin-antitoxin module
MKRALLLTICFVTIAAPILAHAQTKSAKPKDTLDPKCEKMEKLGISDCRERRLKGDELKKCIEKAKLEGVEVFTPGKKGKMTSKDCMKEEKIKEDFGHQCVNLCDKGIVLIPSKYAKSLNVTVCNKKGRAGKDEVVACREQKKCSGSDLDPACTEKNKPKEQKKSPDKDALKKAEEKALGKGDPHTTTHYDCKGMNRAKVCYGASGIQDDTTAEQREQRRLRDGDIAIPKDLKSAYDLNFGDRVLLEHDVKDKKGNIIETRRTWATVRDMNTAPTIDFFREYDAARGVVARESTPMRELGFTYGTTYGDRSQVRIIQVDRSGRFYFK